MALTDKQERFCELYMECEEYSTAIMGSLIETDLYYGDMYYVYLLIDPFTDKIFYIGKGKDRRAEDHAAMNKRGDVDNAGKHKIINDIIESGGEPEIVVFKNNLKEDVAFRLEKQLIKKLKNFVTNKSSGVTHQYDRDKEWARNCLRRAMPYEKWLAAKERPEKHRELYKLCYSRLEKIASGEEIMYTKAKITTRNGISCTEFS